MEPLAEKYDDDLKLSYKIKQKAKFIMGLNKRNDNYKKKKEQEDNSNTNKENTEEQYEKDLEDEFIEEQSLNMGLEDDLFSVFKKKINNHKENKGYGLLISFNKDNEEKRIEKLIKAMKLGLRVVLVSDAGTPTISDPGTILVELDKYLLNNID